ncbi:hypothetical protein [Treponema sp.]|uniref:type III toxin-antitoxin system TenpIN family toxin n=1 Tax=Treponema sp. TaxID=166 RepID=UPI0025EEA891|nr:hypothetical protein [Treponema sp.]MBR4321211.1 hypothetical protein [Treponema sp.]
MEFCFLSKEFYEKYKKCKEILVKQDRPYTVLIIETVNKKFAIPFRSHINPNNRDCFITDKANNAGLDFQKSVVIVKDSYVSTTDRPEVRNIDYIAIHFKDYEIKRKFESFLKFFMSEFKRHKEKPELKTNARIQFCSLQYFTKELGLE